MGAAPSPFLRWSILDDCVRGKTTVVLSIRIRKTTQELKRHVLEGPSAMSFRRQASISILPIQGFDLKGMLVGPGLECLTQNDKIDERSVVVVRVCIRACLHIVVVNP